MIAEASSGLPVDLSILSPSICSLAGTTVTMIASGNCVIDAQQAGNPNPMAASPVIQTIALITDRIFANGFD